MSENQPGRKIIKYEYRIKSTSEYIVDINEFWEVYNVLRPNGYHKFIVVFRRVMEESGVQYE